MTLQQTAVVIVNGAPATGKTHLSRRLARELRLPLLSKDDIKEGLFEGLGWSDREWSKKLGGASFDALFLVLERQLEAGVSCIVETAFMPKFNSARFLKLKQRYNYWPIQIYCFAEVNVLAQRFNRRIATGERHPGHTDGEVTTRDFQNLMETGKYGVMHIGGEVIEVDTTDLNAIDLAKLVNSIKKGR